MVPRSCSLCECVCACAGTFMCVHYVCKCVHVQCAFVWGQYTCVVWICMGSMCSVRLWEGACTVCICACGSACAVCIWVEGTSIPMQRQEDVKCPPLSLSTLFP